MSAISFVSVMRSDKFTGAHDMLVCIASLAELPLQITTCTEAVNDFNNSYQGGKYFLLAAHPMGEVFDVAHTSFIPTDNDGLKTWAQAADCIAEATIAGFDIVSLYHC